MFMGNNFQNMMVVFLKIILLKKFDFEENLYIEPWILMPAQRVV